MGWIGGSIRVALATRGVPPGDLGWIGGSARVALATRGIPRGALGWIGGSTRVALATRGIHPVWGIKFYNPNGGGAGAAESEELPSRIAF